MKNLHVTLFLFLIISTLLLNGCGMDDEVVIDPCQGVNCPVGEICDDGTCTTDPNYVPPAEADEILFPTTVIVDDNTNNNLISIDSTQLVFSETNTQMDSLEVGDVLVSGISDVAPQGYLRRVVSIEQNGGQIVIHTEPAALTDVFEKTQLRFSYTYTEDDEKLGEICLSDEKSVLDFIDVSVSNCFKMDFLFNIDIGTKYFVKPEVEYFKTGFALKNTFDIEVSVSKDTTISKEWLISKIKIAPIQFPTPLGVPIVITNDFVTNFGSSVSASVEAGLTYQDVSTYEAYVEQPRGVGVTDFENWIAASNYDRSSDGLSLQSLIDNISVTASLSGKAVYLKTGIESQLYDYDGAASFAGLSAGLNAEASCTVAPATQDVECNIDVDLRADVFMNMKLEVLNKSLLSYSNDFNLISLDIFDYEFTKKDFGTFIGGSGSDSTTDIIETSDGGYLVVGYSTSTDGDISNNWGGRDVWVVKLNTAGRLEWEKSFGGSGDDQAWAVAETDDNHFIVVGKNASADGLITDNKGGNDFWVLKLNSSGDLIWEKSIGGTKSDYARDIEIAADGSYIILGTTESKNGDVNGGSTPNFYPQNWMVSLDEDGNINWNKAWGNKLNYTYGWGLCIDSDSNYVAVGVDSWRIHHTKINHKDNVGIFEKKFNISNSNTSGDRGQEVVQTADGGYLVAGLLDANGGSGVPNYHGGTDGFLIKTDAEGNVEWQRAYGGSGDDSIFDVQVHPDGGFIFQGRTTSRDGDVTNNTTATSSASDIWIGRVNEMGDLLWDKSLNRAGTSSEWPGGITITSDGYYVSAGTSGFISPNFWIVKFKE